MNSGTKTTVLVTGAGGLSGSAVVQEFARNGTPVRALVRDRAKASAFEGMTTVEIVVGDMAQAETLTEVLDGIERTLMISSSNAGMVETQSRFIDAAKAAGVGQIVKFSGVEVGVGFDQQNFRFTRMHGEIERYLEQSGVAWTHLRPSQFMQVYLREAATIAAEGALYLPMENAKLTPIEIEDIAKIAHRLLRDGGHEGESFEMTGPEALTMTEIAERIGQATGRAIHYVNVSPEERRRIVLARGVPPSMADALDEQASERRKCAASRVCLDVHAMFGVEPTTFAEFARRNVAAFG